MGYVKLAGRAAICVDDVQGKKGKDSAAATYASATPPDGFSIQEDKPYAEVSMAYSPCPSKLTSPSAVDGDAPFATVERPLNGPFLVGPCW